LGVQERIGLFAALGEQTGVDKILWPASHQFGLDQIMTGTCI
jgi:hypothetical protein